VIGSKAVIVSLSMVALLLACGPDGAQRGAARSRPPKPADEWLAVFETARDPNRLDALTKKLVDDFGRATVTTPAFCFHLPASAGIAPDAYVVGLIAATRQELSDKVGEAGLEPAFIGNVHDTCGP
jgi:hypothetical protein